MYFMFVIVGAGGLMVTANLKPIAVDWKVDSVPVTLIGMTMTAVTFAATIDRVLNGLTRPFFGWISDMIGRENTMFIAFGIEGIGIWVLYMLGHDPIWFVILSGFVFFAWGEIYSLFPSTCTDTFGAKFATTNAGLLYTAKGTAALLVPIANYVQQTIGQLGQRVHHRGRRQHPGLAACDRGAQALAQDRGRASDRLSTLTAHDHLCERRAPGLTAGRFRFDRICHPNTAKPRTEPLHDLSCMLRRAR